MNAPATLPHRDDEASAQVLVPARQPEEPRSSTALRRPSRPTWDLHRDAENRAAGQLCRRSGRSEVEIILARMTPRQMDHDFARKVRIARRPRFGLLTR
jgi:hypothetical protein